MKYEIKIFKNDEDVCPIGVSICDNIAEAHKNIDTMEIIVNNIKNAERKEPKNNQEEKPKLKLEVGKWYLDRRGIKNFVSINSNKYPGVSSEKYPYEAIDTEGGTGTFTEEGKLWLDEDKEDKYDLVEKCESPIKLEAGKWYKDAEGKKIKMEVNKGQYFPYFLKGLLIESNLRCMKEFPFCAKDEKNNVGHFKEDGTLDADPKYFIVAECNAPESDKPKIEVGKFYNWDGEKIYIKSDFPQPLFYCGYNPIPRFIAKKSNGDTLYLVIEELIGPLEPWDFKGEKPTVCPEVGKWYKTRKGNIGICTYNNNPLMPEEQFRFNILGHSYNFFGEHYIRSSIDLIEEVPEPKEELVLEVGCWYENRRGEIRKIVRTENHHYYTFVDEKDHSYMIDGTFIEKIISGDDLIKKVSAPISLEVDSFWKARDGSKVYINFKDEKGFFLGSYTNDTGMLIKLYDSTGRTNKFNNNPYDIVAKWVG